MEPVANPDEITSIDGRYLPKSHYNAFMYHGCYSNGPHQIMNGLSIILGPSKAYIKDCFDYASLKGATFFGLTNGTTCTYGSSATNLTVNGDVLSNSICSMDCGSTVSATLTPVNAKPLSRCRKIPQLISNLTDKCGSSSAISTYLIKPLSATYEYRVDGSQAVLEAKQLGLTGTYVYVGCYKHILQYNVPIQYYDKNIVQTFGERGDFGLKFCTGVALKYNAMYFGLQEGMQCMYGSVLPAVQVAEPHCDSKCGNFFGVEGYDVKMSGVAGEYVCGGQYYASMYQRVVSFHFNFVMCRISLIDYFL